MQNIIALLGLTLLLGSTTTNAQTAQETTVKYDKNNVSAVVAEYNRPESVMEDALKTQLDKEGLGKSKKSKGYLSYPGVSWQRIGIDKLDIYFKVDGNKSKTTITVLVSKGYSNFVSGTAEPEIINKVKEFLNNLEKTAVDVQFALDVDAQKEMVAEAEKNYNRSLSDSTDLAKDKQKLENKILEQSSTVQTKRQELDMHRQKLDAMKQ